MGSASVNLLEYVRSKSAIDCDCLDLEFAKELGPFVDCTSNQADAYYELQNPARAALLRDSIVLAREWSSDYPKLSFEELALDVAMVKLSLSMAPHLTGDIHVMANPTRQNSTAGLIENGQRIARILRKLDPSFDAARLVIKVVSTWEGLQACKKLEGIGIKTIATTLFTWEQAVLAAEAKCEYIAPFLHELKAFFDESYKDNDPCFDLCVKVQKYYEQHSLHTRVKVAGLLTSDQAIQLAGAQTMTVAPAVIRTLSESDGEIDKLADLSLYKEIAVVDPKETPAPYGNDETRWREEFKLNNGGKGAWKTAQAIDIFSDYQLKGEELIRETARMF